MKNLNEALEKVSLIEQLEEEGYDTALAESMANIAYNYDENEEPGCVCHNRAELEQCLKHLLGIEE